jgi:hypothetical protein
VNSIAVFVIALAFIFGGALVGVAIRKALPEHHLAGDTKDVIRLGTGLVATIAALVLGLLIASANSSFQTKNGQVQRITADLILLDGLLAQYGPEARPVRKLVRPAVALLVERIWGSDQSRTARSSPFKASAAGEEASAMIDTLETHSEAQRLIKARAERIGVDLMQTRLHLLEQAGNAIPIPFLAVLVFWLAIIFASFGMFSRLNPISTAALFVFALSAAAAIFLIVELSQPFSGLMQISSDPLKNALGPI